MVIQQTKTFISTQQPLKATPPVFEKPPVAKRFVEGGDATFECYVRGNPAPEVVWSRKGTPIRNDQRHKVSYNPDTGLCTLHITGLTAEEHGDYTCTASNSRGTASLTVTIQREVKAQVYEERQEVFKSQQLIQHTTLQHAYQSFGQERIQQSSVQKTLKSVQDGQTGYQQPSYEKTIKSEKNGPFNLSSVEGFRVDTFEYRLLKETEFRESFVKRQQGEAQPSPPAARDTSLPPCTPEVLQRPRNIKLLEGADATFQAKISGNPRPTIIWFKNGEMIVQSQRYTVYTQDTIATLRIRMVLPEDAGYYTLLAENPSGRVVCSAHLVIEAMGTVSETKYTSLQRLQSLDEEQRKESRPTKPISTSKTESESDIISSKSLKPSFIKIPTQKEVTEGQMVRFDCRVSGRPFPDVLWFHNGKQIMDDGTHKLLVNEGGMHALMITVTTPKDSGTYTCTARNKGGETSFEVNLVVKEKEEVSYPKFIEKFQSKHVKEGEPVTLSCRAIGTPTPHITWQKDGVQIYSKPPEQILETHEGNSRLFFSSVTAQDSAWYQCTAQNQAGSTAIRARLYVTGEPQVAGEPWKLSLPRPTKVIRPEGSPPRETIWLRHIERSQPHVPHEEESRPSQKPEFVTHLRNLHLQEGERASFEARLIPIGDPTMQIEWFVNGKLLEASSRAMTIDRFGYVALTLLHVNSDDSGTYQCHAKNVVGEAITTATLHVSPRAVIESGVQHPESWEAIQQLEDWERYKRHESVDESLCPSKPVFTKPLNNLENLQEGGFAHFEAQVTPVSDFTMTIEWYFNGQPLTASTRVSTVFSFGYVALHIKYLRAEDSGVYMCKAINQKGEAVSSATLKVKTMGEVIYDLGYPEQQRYQEKIQELEAWQQQQRQQIVMEEAVPQMAPVFRTPLRDAIDIQEGKIARFEARVEPTGDSSMRVEWLKDGKPLEASYRTTIFFNFGYVSLTIRGVDTRDSGTYTCVATNSIGTAKSSAKLTCQTKQNVVLESQYPEGLEKIQHLEDSSRYQRETYEETNVTQRPKFTEPLVGKDLLVEGKSAHFETRLEPIGDPNMIVEWYFNGRPLTTGHRFKTYFDFGYVALDILYVFPEDSGDFTVKARNAIGEATQSKTIRVQSKSSIDTTTIHEVGLEQIEYLERPHHQEPHYLIEEFSKSKPIFTHPLHDPKPLREGERVHLECRLEPANDTTMKVEWFFNGKPLKSGSRFHTRYEFGFVALDILTVYPEDTGEYTVRATNHLGSSHTSANVKVVGKSSIDTTTIHEVGLEQIEYLERPHHQEPHYLIEEFSKSKPIFTHPLHDSKPLREGERVHLECRLEPANDTTMKVEWFFNGKPLKSGSRFHTRYEFGFVALDILTVYPEDTGEYTVRATNHLGSSHTSANVKVVGKSAVILESQCPEGLEKIQQLEDTSRYRRTMEEETVITQKPTFTKSLHNIQVIEGTNIHLECRLAPVGDPSMKVDWYINNVPIRIGHRFRPAHEFDYVALDILSIYPEDSGVYTCKATSSLGQAVTSCSVSCIAKSQVILESQQPESLEKIQYLEDTSRYKRDTWVEEAVKVRPKFTDHMHDLSLREGQQAHFECRLEPVNDSSLRVEWFRNGVALPSGHRYRLYHDFGYVALTILSVVPEDTGSYTCRATNSMGTAEVSAKLMCQSKTAIISETQHPEGLQKIQQLESYTRYTKQEEEKVITQVPVFVSQLHDVEIKEGQRVHFECRLLPVGDTNLKVEWFRNGQPIKMGTRFVETLSFGFVALDIMYAYPEDAGTYMCRATNALGEAVTSAQLRCYEKDKLILESQQPDSLQKIQQLEDSSRYHKTTTVEETISQSPVFVQPMRNLQLQENQSAHFECRLIPIGDPKLKVEWFFNGVALMQATRVTTMHDFGYAALDLAYVKPEDSGTYMCKATNELGQAVCSATLSVKGSSNLLLESQQPDSLHQIQYLEDSTRHQREVTEETVITSRPVFVSPLRGPTKLTEGQNCHLECRIDPYPDPTMKIEWFYNGQLLKSAHRFRTVYDFGYVALDIFSVNAEDSGEYMVKATNCMGTSTSSVVIRVTAKSGLILESQQPDSLQQIQYLEDESRLHKTVVEEVVYDQRPAFKRLLHDLENLVEGQRVHLEATLTPVNDPNLKIEWFFNGCPIQQGHRFKTTCDFGYVALDILYVLPEDTGTYICKAVNNVGEAVTTCSLRVQSKSGIILDTLHEEGLEKIRELETSYIPKAEEPVIQVCPPVFLKPLINQENLMEGKPVHLECRLEPVNDPKLQVIWYINGVEIQAGHRFRTTHDFGYVALDILYANPEDTGIYMCKAVNELGEAVSTCSIKIQGRRNVYYETQHPEGLEKIRELECQPKYQSVEVEERPVSKPYFTLELKGITELVEGQTGHFECRVEPAHDSNLHVDILHNGKPLEAGSRFHVTFDFGYVALDIRHVLPEDTGMFTVKAKNNVGEATSSINIRVQAKTSIIMDTQHPEGLAKIQALEDEARQRSDVYVEPRTFQRPVFTAPLQNLDDLIEGQSAHLECRLIPVGDPTLKVEWFFNEKSIQPGSRVKTTHDFGYVALDIQYIRPDDVGVYMCRASNEMGEAVTTATIRVVKTKTSIILETQHPEGLEKIQELESAKTLAAPEVPEKVFEKPVFTMALTGPLELVEGQPAHFKCRVIPVGDPNLKFEWFVNGVELKMGTRFQVTHDFGLVSLDIMSTIPEDSGVYMCKAVNLAGEAVTSTSIKIRSRKGVLGESQHPEAYKKTQKFELDSTCIPEVWWDAKQPTRPIFTKHLVNQERLIEGQNVRIEGTLEPIDDEKLKVEWFKNSKTITQGTRIRLAFDFGHVTLDIYGIRPEDSGIYTCRAVNEAGEAVSTCTIKVEGREAVLSGSQHPGSLPKIQQLETTFRSEPEFVEPSYESPVFITHLNNLEVREGEPAHFQCQVEPSRDPTLIIDFLVNGKPLPAATKFMVKNDFGFVTLDISHAYTGDAGVYTCRATNNKGQAVTTGSLKVHGKEDIIYGTQHPMGQVGLSRIQEVEEAYLSRYQMPLEEAEQEFPKPVFVEPLQANFTVNEGEGLRLYCRYEPSADPKLAIEWFFNGKPLELASRFTSTSDFGQVTLTISDLWPRDCGIYTCRAHNKRGEAFTSTTLQCVGKSFIYEGTLHPEGEKGLERIQDLEESLVRQSERVLLEEEGHPPVFTSQFQNLTNLSEGDIAHFEATLTPAGDQTMVVEWFFNEKPLKAGHRIRTVHAFGMVVLEILGVIAEDTGRYICRATNKWGKAEITVTLETIDRSRGQKPHFTTQLQSIVGLKEGDSAHFECFLIPVGDPAMKVEWFHNGQPLRDSSRIKTLSDFGYVVMDISFVHVEDVGEYICVATNKYGSDTTRCILECAGHGKIFRDSLQPQSLEKIAALEGYSHYKTSMTVGPSANQPPRFHSQIQPLINLVEGQSAHFETQLSPVNDPNLKVEWFFNGQPLRHGHRFRTFHDFGIVILDILYCYGEDSGEYMCKATNRLGTDVTKTVLRCKSKSSLILEPQLPPEMAGGTERIIELEESLYHSRMEISEEITREAPRFTKPLDNLTNMREGENAHFEARLIPTDDPDLKLEWFKDGKPLRAGTRIRTIHDFGFVVLEISPVYPEDSGIYSCRAVNRLGEAVTTCTMKCEGKRGIILETQLPEGMETGIEKIARFEDISSTRVAETWIDTDVSQAPKFISKPQDISLPENSLAHFECRLIPVGDPTMRVEWFHNGKPLITGTRVRSISDFGFVILEIAGVYQRDNGVYTCKAVNRIGEATTSANLIVKSKASIVVEPQLPEDFKSSTTTLQHLEESLYQKQEIVFDEEKPQPPRFITHIRDLTDKVEGDFAHFECRLEPQGDPNLRVEWYYNGQPLITGSRVHTINDFGFVVLEIDWLFPRDAGEYVCKAINRWGTDSTRAVLKVKNKRDIIMESQLPEGMSADKLRALEYPLMQEQPVEESPLRPPHFVTQIQPQENLSEGDSAHFECHLEPVDDPKLRVEWYRNGQPLRTGHKFKTTHDFGYVALDVLYVYPEDSGEYMARAINDLGEDITRTTLKCKGKPALIYQTQLPKEMEGGVRKIVEMEAAWQRVEDIEEMPQERTAPIFVMKPEPQVVLEGDVAKFQCRVTGNPRPRLMWILNNHSVIDGSRYRLTYDGIFHLEIPKSKLHDQGKVEVIARNALGQAYCWTTLEVKPQFNDYRAVLKHSPKPWYDSEIKRYQRDRQDSELQRVFEEKLTPGGTKIDVWKTQEQKGEHIKIKERLEEEDIKKMQPEVKRFKTDAFYIDSVTGERRIEQESQVSWMAKSYQDKVEHTVHTPMLPETVVHGKEVQVSKQKQTQKEVKGEWEVTRHTTLTETMEQEHKGVTQERKVVGPVAETKPPFFTKKIQPCPAVVGDTAKFDCSFTGTPTPTITWYRENFPISPSQKFMIKTTDKTSTLTIEKVCIEDSGMFSVKAENRGGSAKSSSNLVVEERKEKKKGLVPPSFTKTIQEVSAKAGHLVRLDASVTGSKPFEVHWLKNGQKVIPDITHKTLEEEDLYTLLILEATPDDTGTYECLVLNKVGEARCQAKVHIEGTASKVKSISPKEVPKETACKGPEIIEPLKPVTIKEGQPAVFKCRISGSPAPLGKWFRGDTLIKQSRYFRMSVENDVYSLRISEAFPEDKGVYKCVAANSAGTVSTTANLIVIAPEAMEAAPSLSPLVDLKLPEGSPARFVTSVAGVPTPHITWYKGGTIIKASRKFQMAQDAGSCSLVIRQTCPEDKGIYTCKATNTSGQAETSARLAVESKH